MLLPHISLCSVHAFGKPPTSFAVFLFGGQMNILKSVEYYRGAALQKKVQEGEKHRPGSTGLRILMRNNFQS